MNAASKVLIVVLATLCVSLPQTTRAAEDARTKAEIDYLLSEVGGSHCVFIRNGKEHDARAAREHLASKRRRGRRYFDTTEEFIDRIASKSSMSRKDYHIRCDGNTVTAKAWFTARLEAYRGRKETLPETSGGI